MKIKIGWSRLFNVATNAILIIALTTFLISYGRRYLAEQAFTDSSVSTDGKKIAIAGVDFSQSDQTILLVLDKDCRFCQQETPFYQRLVERARTKGVRVIGVFQHDLAEAVRYLSNEQIHINESVRLRFRTIGVDGTPNLFVLNRDGKIIGTWSGSLSEPIRDYLISIVGVKEEIIREEASPYLTLGNRTPPPLTDANSLKSRLEAGDTTLVDIDYRKEFATRHLDGAVNLPIDEIYARALNELPRANSIVLFSRTNNLTTVTNAKATLQQIGFEKVEWFRQTLEESKASGLEVVSESKPTAR